MSPPPSEPRRIQLSLPPEEFRRGFLARVGDIAEISVLFDHIQGVTFFMKDRDGRFVATGCGLRQELLRDEEDWIGRTDYDMHPRHIADRIRADDRRVMETNRPLLNIVEILVTPHCHAIGWYVTNKYPVHDHAGQVIGVMGTVQPFEGRRKLVLTGTRLDEALDHIETHYAQPLTSEALARVAAMSERQFRRSFQEAVGTSPQDFILRTRIIRACTALANSPDTIAGIALECGFCDQSAFSTQFRRVIGTTPMDYRKRHTSLLSVRHQPLKEVGRGRSTPSGLAVG